MMLRVYLDSNFFIYAFEFPESNSAKILDLLHKGEIEAVISEIVIKEVTAYFKRFHTIEKAREVRRYLLETCSLVMKYELIEQINKFKGKIKDKDLEQLAATKKYGIKFLIAYDKDFECFEEYITPKKFLQKLNKEFSENEF